MLKGKTILVTGSAGLIGSFTVKRLLSLGARVRAFVRRPEDTHVKQLQEYAAKLESPSELEVSVGDMNDEQSLRRAVSSPTVVDGVVHAAAYLLGPDADLAFNTNVIGSMNLWNAAQEAGVTRFVHLSTVGVFDFPTLWSEVQPGQKQYVIIDEDKPMAPFQEKLKGFYSVNKAEAERRLRVAAAASPSPVTVYLRPSLVLGSHPNSVGSNQFPMGIRTGQFPVPDNGTAPLDWVDLESVIDAIVASLTVVPAEKVHNQAFIISDTVDDVTYADYAKACLPKGQELPYVPFSAIDDNLKMLFGPQKFNTEKSRKILGLVPRNTFAQRLQEIEESLTAIKP